MRRMTRLACVLAALTAAAACGGSSGQSAGSPSPVGRPSTSAAEVTTTPSEATSGSAAPSTSSSAAGGPVPAGFEPWSVTAVSDHTFWVLGDAPCSHQPCTSIVRTTDGGAHFAGIPAPKATLAYPSQGTASTVSEIRFADADDGWVFGPGLFATHDGGQSWHPVDVGGDVVQLVASGGTVWAVVGKCDSGVCSDFRLEKAAASSDRFSAVSLPLSLGSSAPQPSIAVQGKNVYVLDNAVATGRKFHSTLLVSDDSGAHFTRRTSPCTIDLGGTITATAGAVWAVCPTGMLAGVFRADADGSAFASVNTPHSVPNSTSIGAAGNSLVVLGVGSELLRSADGGHHWLTVWHPGNGSVSVVGFTDENVGYVIVSGAHQQSLLRTDDGGKTWRTVTFR